MTEFKSHELMFASSSEESCQKNTAPETLQPLIQGFLNTMTGLDWEVRVENVPVEGAGDFLRIRALVNMSISKALIGSEPTQPVVPPEALK